MFLDSFFENSAKTFPNNIAIEEGKKRYTYIDAEQLANKLANYLRGLSIGPEDKVTILLPRCAEVIISMLGILKAGAAYIPLDPEIPADRVNFIMEDADAKLLITSNEILDKIGEQLSSFPIFNIDEQRTELDNYPDTKPIVNGRSEDNLCYMIYTSGTTGKPKGVLLMHKNAATYVNGARKIYPIKENDRALQGFSVSFDASVEEIWVPLSAGATLVIGTFVGNSAVMSPGTKLGDDVLVGVLSKMKEENLPAKDGTNWFGSPAVFLPRRDVNHDFSAERTYKPSRKLFCYRYFIEFFRVVLPSTFFIFMAGLITDVTSYMQIERDLSELILWFPLLYIGASIIGIFITALLKWIIVGKYIPQNKPLWSGFVWRSELVTGLYENFLVLFCLNILTGTPFIKYPLRLLGCKIGKRACLFTTQITEFDLIHVDDYAALNDNCTMQTHLFEDRVMKMSYVTLEENCSVGGMSVVLYDSKMEKNAILDPLSVLMKNETLSADNRYIGAPAKRV